jgi:hypothetical protein
MNLRNFYLRIEFGKQRLVDIGVVTAFNAKQFGMFWCNVARFRCNLGFKGIFLRMISMVVYYSGCPWVSFGDCYDR